MTKKRNTTYHISREDTADESGQQDRVDGSRLQNIRAPGAPSERSTPQPRKRSESFDYIRVSSRMGIPVIGAQSPLTLLDPESTLRLVTQSHMDYFGDDFWAAEGEFIRLRFHVGARGDVYEFYSDSFPLGADSWRVVQDQIHQHIRSELSQLDRTTVEQIPVRMVFFHDPRIHAPAGDTNDVLRHPLDFATSVEYTVEDFIGFVSYGRHPERFRLKFDASYMYLGLATEDAFGYSKHWLFFSEVLRSFAELFGSPLKPDELPLCVLREHAGQDVAQLVTGIGMSEKRTYQDRERVYRPEVDVLFEPTHLVVRLTDATGILRGFTNHYAAGAYRKQTDGDVTILSRAF